MGQFLSKLSPAFALEASAASAFVEFIAQIALFYPLLPPLNFLQERLYPG